MRTTIVLAALLALAGLPGAAAKDRASGDGALGAELSREKAETRIERLRQDQRDERVMPRAQETPAAGTKTKKKYPQR